VRAEAEEEAEEEAEAEAREACETAKEREILETRRAAAVVLELALTHCRIENSASLTKKETVGSSILTGKEALVKARDASSVRAERLQGRRGAARDTPRGGMMSSSVLSSTAFLAGAEAG
jgi:hypothetical protein